MNKIAVLPVRSNSKRVIRKNFIEFCGIPLYSIVLSELVASNCFDKVIFAVDHDEKIPQSICLDSRVSVYRRKGENSGDFSSSEDILIEVADFVSCSDDDFIFLFQATNPFLRREYTLAAVDGIQKPGVDSIISTVESKRFDLNEVVDKSFRRARTQDRNIDFLETGVLWGVQKKILDEKRSRIGLSPATILIKEGDDFDIDTVQDVESISFELQKYIVENRDIHAVLKDWFPLELQLIKRQFGTIEAMQSTYTRTFIDNLEIVAASIKSALLHGGKVVLFGNGGSAADSQHIAAEFVSRLATDRIPLPAIALTTDTSALTAIGNDYGFEYLFERQVNALVKSNDVVIGITTSGTSQNVLKGLAAAQRIGASTIMLTGLAAPKSEYADVILQSASTHTATIQEVHIQIGHIICALGEENYV